MACRQGGAGIHRQVLSGSNVAEVEYGSSRSMLLAEDVLEVWVFTTSNTYTPASMDDVNLNHVSMHEKKIVVFSFTLF